MSLKELTAEAHKQAETQPFVKLIFSGNITKEKYAEYLINQELAYLTLEAFAQDAGLLDDLPGIKRAE
jgi:heme oxygenase